MDYDFITTCNWTSTGTFTLRAYRGGYTNVVTSYTLYYRKKGTSTWNSTVNGEITIDSTGEWEVANDWNKSGNDVLTHSYYGITAINSCTNVYFNEATLSATVGNYFLYMWFLNCSNLVSMPIGFNLPQGITTVGSNFLDRAWLSCSNLTSMPVGFNLPQGITTVGSNFLYYCWYGCSSLTSMPVGFNLPQGITSVGTWFIADCWGSCDNLTSMPVGFNLPQGITGVGGYFLYGCWRYCYSLTSMPVGFNLPQGITSVSNDFVSKSWEGCNNLASMPSGFNIPSGITSSGSSFFYWTWYGCKKLKQDGYTEDLVFEFDSDNTFGSSCPIVPDSITGASKENPVRVAVNRPAPPPLRHWVGGSGNWDDTSHWSVSSGGPGGASVPTEEDDVFIDGNSGFSSGGTITAPLGVCKGLVLSPGIAVDLGTSQIDIASLQAIGTSDSLISITGGTLSKPSGFVQCDYLNLTNSTATGGAMWYAGEHSIDNGGNVGWRFGKKRKYPLPARPWKA